MNLLLDTHIWIWWLTGQPELALRSGISAASCFWSAGHPDRARPMFDDLLQSHPAQAEAIRQIVEELERDYPVMS